MPEQQRASERPPSSCDFLHCLSARPSVRPFVCLRGRLAPIAGEIKHTGQRAHGSPVNQSAGAFAWARERRPASNNNKSSSAAARRGRFVVLTHGEWLRSARSPSPRPPPTGPSLEPAQVRTYSGPSISGAVLERGAQARGARLSREESICVAGDVAAPDSLEFPRSTREALPVAWEKHSGPNWRR